MHKTLAAMMVASCVCWAGCRADPGGDLPTPNGNAEAAAERAPERGEGSADAARQQETVVRAGEPIPWKPRPVGEFSFTERSGKTVTGETLKGKPWVVGFVFTRCAGPCLTVTGNMRQLQRRTGIQLVTITVDPKYDTPEVLTKYANAFAGLTPERAEEWLFLTGDQREIYTLIAKTFEEPVKEITGPDRVPGFEVLHSANVFLIDKEGTIQGRFNGRLEEEMVRLRRAIEALD